MDARNMSVVPSVINIDLSRDQDLYDFSKTTLKDRYLMPGETSPQQGFARAAAAFADDEDHAQRLYDYVSRGWFMFATPLLSNGGTTRGQPISCFLAAAEDSREGIFSHWAEVGWLSSFGGGVGGYWPLRANGEETSQGSSSTGPIPFVAAMDRIILSVSQGGTRRGSYAAYMDIDHPNILEFITIRKAGGDVNRKALNLHNAVNITDAFMYAVRDDTDYPLVDPHSKKITKYLSARAVWRLLIETRMQTGEPYMHFTDTSNRAMPAAQRALGLRVSQSNLCVAPNTELLTSSGYLPIGSLENEKVKVWNGQDWSETTIMRTSEQSELVRVWFNDGSYLDCTPDHKFYDAAGVEIRAAQLRDGTVLEPSSHPIISNAGDTDMGPAAAYTAGYAVLAGIEDDGALTLLVDEDAADLTKMRLTTLSVDMKKADGVLAIRFEHGSVKTGFVPLRWTVEARRSWFGGLVDAVGEWVNVDGIDYLGFAHDDADLIREMRLMALELGMQPVIRTSDTGNCFLLSAWDANGLIMGQYSVGHEPRLISIDPDRAQIVADVHRLPYKTATYCFTEAERHKAIFNGVLAGQCTEIMLHSGRDHLDKMRTAVCCLSSVNAEKKDEWIDHPDFIEDLMRMLDNALEVFITTAPAVLENAIYSASRERSVGLGLLGFHSLLQSKNIAFDSEEARDINKMLFRHLRSQADAASLKLGAERGEAPDMAGTGERFAHKLALAPNASSSILLYTSPSTEPIPANIFLHKTLSGSFVVKNKHLVRLLESKGQNTDAVWKSITAAEGSVQHLDCLDEYEKRVFLCAFEMDMMPVIEMAIDRTQDICQGQSVNIFMAAGTDAETLTRVHYRAWEGGVKSLYYLRSTAPKRGENVNTEIERTKTVSFDASHFYPDPSKGLEEGRRVDIVDQSDLDLGNLVRDTLAKIEASADDDCFACQG
jgi:ribonucleoside-diphosphate reductase alpha chain